MDFVGKSLTRNGHNIYHQGNLNIEELEQTYNEYLSDFDTYGIAKTLEIKRLDNTLYQKIQLSQSNGNGQYQTLTKITYSSDGLVVLTTDTFTLTYRAEDKNPRSSPISVIKQ